MPAMNAMARRMSALWMNAESMTLSDDTKALEAALSHVTSKEEVNLHHVGAEAAPAMDGMAQIPLALRRKLVQDLTPAELDVLAGASSRFRALAAEGDNTAEEDLAEKVVEATVEAAVGGGTDTGTDTVGE